MNQKRTYPEVHGGSKLFDLLPGIYYHLRFNARWEIVDVTDRAVSLLGYSKEEIYRTPHEFLARIIHPEDISLINHRKKQVFHTGELFLDEYRVITKNGDVKFVRDQYTCFQDEHGTWLMEGYMNEIHHLTINDRLIQQLQAYRNAVDVHMICSITNRNGQIVFANDNFCRISKYAQWELVGQNHRIVNSGHHSKEFFAQMWKTITAGQLWHGEILNKAKDGTLYWVDTVIIPIFDETKQVMNYLSLRMVIDERKEAEQQRKAYVHMLEQIAFIVAHNVRGPLCSILGLTDLLLNYSNTSSEFEQCVRYLHDAATKLNSITQTLSKFVYEHEIEFKSPTGVERSGQQ